VQRSPALGVGSCEVSQPPPKASTSSTAPVICSICRLVNVLLVAEHRVLQRNHIDIGIDAGLVPAHLQIQGSLRRVDRRALLLDLLREDPGLRQIVFHLLESGEDGLAISWLHRRCRWQRIDVSSALSAALKMGCEKASDPTDQKRLGQSAMCLNKELSNPPLAREMVREGKKAV
jgi:hypothetical protein